MIWIIASIPFWLLAIASLVMGIACIGLSFDDRFLRSENIRHKRGGYLAFGIVVCLPVSGCVALIAAKICS